MDVINYINEKKAYNGFVQQELLDLHAEFAVWCKNTPSNQKDFVLYFSQTLGMMNTIYI